MPSTPISGSESTLPEPGGAVGDDQLYVEPEAIPEITRSLQVALDQLGPQIEGAFNDLRIVPWAGDPVSAAAAEQFNEMSFGGSEAAFNALCDYRDQLQSAAGSLEEAEQQYRLIEDDNTNLLEANGC
ncbi:hypothetical protein [Actinoalloteichus hymeniacidonis]|uniref:PE domain-containing protein n=1 Tax=Actinoalloteichus hymeniacidonis TaxID=340345 RepID=A0AAC9HTR9_9PSEU|nr:hypothetical protein [Actinoalloteichus hymeniacidonis]AOS65532.1 hypothetical protein TL08_23760 [Actinoalloteichus hymeniacidonis]MBB5906380.1 hypothetical protein [Actinoalloteichus hymeniacidonis]